MCEMREIAQRQIILRGYQAVWEPLRGRHLTLSGRREARNPDSRPRPLRSVGLGGLAGHPLETNLLRYSTPENKAEARGLLAGNHLLA